MYVAQDAEVYRTYGATFVGWGGADTPERVRWHHDLGIRCTGSMWCLTAGAKRLHEEPALREAVGRDIAGAPIAVPWLWDHTHEGTPCWFGCTNHPAFRQHNRDMVRQVMAGGADGLHVDDHLGVAATATWMGAGCFCDSCLKAFREWLKQNGPTDRLRDAGVRDLTHFDYRAIVRRFAADRVTYNAAHQNIPLMDLFKRFHLEAAAENVRELGELAAEIAGHPVLVSANAAQPEARQKGIHQVVWPYVTHVIGELEQHAADGTDRLDDAIAAYRLATRMNKPLAATAAGTDWAFVKANNAAEIVRLWIAIAYAHGQRFMAPHRMWCFTPERGTHWYDGPTAAFAPLFQFVRRHAAWLDDFEELADAPVAGAAPARGLLRRHPATGATVMHALNWNYDRATHRLPAVTRTRFTLPASAVPPSGRMRLLSPDRPDEIVAVSTVAGAAVVEIPELRLWTMAVPA